MAHWRAVLTCSRAVSALFKIKAAEMPLPRQVPISFPKKWGIAYTGSGNLMLGFEAAMQILCDGSSVPPHEPS